MKMMKTGADDLPMWRTSGRNMVAELLLSPEGMAGADPLEPVIAGFDIRLTLAEGAAPVPAEAARLAQVLVVEVCRDRGSLERFGKVIDQAGTTQVIAAVRGLSVDDARVLLRAGAADVLPLPLKAQELEAALGRIRSDLGTGRGGGGRGRIVTVLKSVGGVGATTILTQVACMTAMREAGAGKEVCLLDLDLQFGSAALYLGSLPKLGFADLIGAGSRADGAFLRATTARHASGLNFVAAPPEMLPLESVTPDQALSILDLAAREFDTIFVDLPTNWTNWSLSALARSDLILLVSELTVAGLHQSRRQLDLIEQQELGAIPLQVVMNRVEKGLFKSINLGDAARTLGREIGFTVANDPETVRAALDQGVMLGEVRSKSRIAADLRAIVDQMPALVGVR